MLWNKAKPSDNVSDERKNKGIYNAIGAALAGGLTLSLLAALGVKWNDKQPNEQQTIEAVQEHAAALESLKMKDPHRIFVQQILGSTEATWTKTFEFNNLEYIPPKLILIDEPTSTPCGTTNDLAYCSPNQTIYINLSRLGSIGKQGGTSSEPSDFAQAFVIAHEVGHHVQNLLGTTEAVDDAEQSGQDVKGRNGIRVRKELQADCFAGVWARNAEAHIKWLEPTDLGEAVKAARLLGNDTTHGTGEQRSRWFMKAFNAGASNACDTFGAQAL